MSPINLWTRLNGGSTKLVIYLTGKLDRHRCNLPYLSVLCCLPNLLLFIRWIIEKHRVSLSLSLQHQKGSSHLLLVSLKKVVQYFCHRSMWNRKGVQPYIRPKSIWICERYELPGVILKWNYWLARKIAITEKILAWKNTFPPMLQLFIIHFNLNIIFSFPTLRRKIGKLVQIVTEII